MKSLVRTHYGRLLFSRESYRRLQNSWASVERPARSTPIRSDTATGLSNTTPPRPAHLFQRLWADAA